MLTSGLAARKGLTEREHRLLMALGICALLLGLVLQWTLHEVTASAFERPDRCGTLHLSCDEVRDVLGD